MVEAMNDKERYYEEQEKKERKRMKAYLKLAQLGYVWDEANDLGWVDRVDRSETKDQ